MFKELKKMCMKNTMWFTVICFVAAVILIAIKFKEIVIVFAPAEQYSELMTENIKKSGGKKVEIEIDLNYGMFMESYVRQNGSERTTSYSYVILNYDEADPRYMAIKLPVSYKNAMDKLEDYTYDGTPAETITVTAVLSEMTNTEKKYFKEFFVNHNDFTESEYNAETIPFVLKKYEADTGALVLGGIGAVLLLIALIAFAIQFSGAGLKKIKKQIKKSGYESSIIENDYETAGYSLKNSEYKIGRIASYCFMGNTPEMVINKDIVWAYQMTTTHSTNGIKTGTSYALYIWDVNKKNYQIIMSESEVRESMQYMQQHMPWVLVGYSDEMKREFGKNFNGFLEAAYNKVPHDFV